MSETENTTKTEAKAVNTSVPVDVTAIMRATFPIQQKLFKLQVDHAQALAVLCTRYAQLIQSTEGEQQAGFVQCLKSATEIFAARAKDIEIPVDITRWSDHSPVQDSFGVAT